MVIMGETFDIGPYKKVHATIMEALVGPEEDGATINNARVQLEAAIALTTSFLPDPTKVTNLASLSDALAADTPDVLRQLAARVAAYESDVVQPPHQVIAALDISGRTTDNDYLKILADRATMNSNRMGIYATLIPER